jgi:hypothetical protein
MYKFYLKLFVFVILISHNLVKAQCPNFNNFETSYTLQNSSSTNISAKAYPFYLNTSSLIASGQMSTNGNEIRVGSSCCVFYPFYIDSSTWNTPNTLIWVRISGIQAYTSLTIKISYGGKNMPSFNSFANTFQSVYKLNTGADTLDGNHNYDWFEIKSGATLFLRQELPLEINASFVRIAGIINGNTKGYLGAKNQACATGGGPGGGFPNTTCIAAGAGSYGGNAGCTQAPGGICAISGAQAYGTPNGDDIYMGSGGGTGTMGASFNSGGNGGGSLRITSIIMNVSGAINMNGQDGQSNSSAGTAGGGGAGGGILLKSAKLIFSNAQFSAQAGKAGNQYAPSGGGGRIKIFYQISKSGTFVSNVNSTNQHSMNGTILVPGAVGQVGSFFIDSSNQSIIFPALQSSQQISCSNAYYLKPSGAVNDTASWGINTDGTGASPSNFATNSTYYYITNQNAINLGNSWNVSGANTVIVIGSGLTLNSFNIPPNQSLQIDSIVLKNGLTFMASGALICNKLYAENNSNCIFDDSIHSQNIPLGRYYNLNLSGSNKILAGHVQITNQLVLNAKLIGNNYVTTIGSTANSPGSIIRNSGYVNGKLNRWIPSSTFNGSQGFFPIGSIVKYSPLQFDFTTAPSSGILSVEFISNNPGSNGLPFTDNSLLPNVIINKVAQEGYWNVSTLNGLSGGVHNLTAKINGMSGVLNPSLIRMTRRFNSSSSWSNIGISDTISGSIFEPSCKKKGLTLIQGEVGIAGDTATNSLPVKFIKLELYQDQNEINLDWYVANEINVDSYIVEKNSNRNWETIGRILATGNSNTIKQYSFKGQMKFESNDCFRIKAIDFDGAASFSSHVCFKNHNLFNADQFNVYPNPFNQSLNLQFSNTSSEISYIWKLTNLQGLALKSGKENIAPNSIGSLNLNGVSPGFYILEVEINFQVYRKLIIKN